MFTLYHADCVGHEENCLYPHKVEVTDAESLAKAVSRDYVCARYKNSYRSNKNMEESDCVAVEFDNVHSDDPDEWVTPEKLKAELPDVEMGIHYSRNHMKEKKGRSPRPKFHAMLRVSKVTDPEAYKKLKEMIAARIAYVDTNALDSARFFYGTENPQVEYYPGEKALDEFFEEEEFDANLPSRFCIPEGSRNSTMSRFAGRVVKRFGWNDGSHKLFLDEAQKCDPPLEDAELAKIWNSARKFEKVVSAEDGYIPPDKYNAGQPYDGPLGSLKPEDYSDIGQAKVLARECSDELCFNKGAGYFFYNGNYWQESEEAALGAAMRFLDMQLYDANLLLFKTRQALISLGAEDVTQKANKKALEKLDEQSTRAYMEFLSAQAYEGFVMQRRNMKYIKPAMEAAKPFLTVELDDLNRDPYLLNTPQASYRLKDGLAGRQEHDWKDFCTKITAVEPGDEGANLWGDALQKTFCGDRELIDYVQRVVGLAATGKVNMEAMIIAYGEGRNGKSTFWNTIAKVLGSYSGNVSADTLTVGCRRNVKPEMAELKGVRLALAKELEEGMRLNTSIVKQLTSTDEILGEKKYYKPTPFTPSHTLVLYTNHLPRVGATDEGTWRRLIVIPFNAVFEGSGDKKNYSDYLFENAGPAVLAWVIEGARLVMADGFHLKNPKIVQDAIDEYRSENDWFSEFFQECCEADPSFTEKSGELYLEYRAYCLRMGEFARSTAEFYKVLASKGYNRRKTKTGSIVYGLRLKSEFGDS